MDKFKKANYDIDSKSKSLIEFSNEPFEIISDKSDTKKVAENNDFVYCVRKGDTIERVAAKFMMTPNGLMSMNKLHSRTLLVNQKLKVIKPDENETLDSPGRSNGGHGASYKNIKCASNVDSISCDIMLSPLHYEEDHLKVISKYITDSEGIIKGKLLLTSVFFTFIPAFSDPVIMEYGDDNYNVHLPNNKIEGVCMYNNSEMMTYKRSQRKDMINKNVEPIKDIEWKSMINYNVSDTEEHQIVNQMDDYSRSFSLDDFLNRSDYVHDFEKVKNTKFIDHKYLCVVASPRYRKIKAGSQKEDEYWFMVPTDSAQALMDYFLTHSQTRHDIGDDVDSTNNWMNDSVSFDSPGGQMVKRNSFAKIEDVHGSSKMKNKLESNIKKLRSKSIQWEIVNTDLDFRLNSFDESEEVKSRILDSTQIKELMKHMPAETVGATWELIYTTDRDGWSLNTLYRNVYNSTRGCCLLLIKDSYFRVFGAMCSSYLRMSSSFYGNGTTFIFRWSPDFEKFSYSAKNHFFLFGQPNYFAIGCSNCNNAIRIEKTLFNGTTQACDTFNNPPLVSSESFEILTLEVWSFY